MAARRADERRAVQADAAAAIASCASAPAPAPVIAVGFCFGGFQAFPAAAAPELGPRRRRRLLRRPGRLALRRAVAADWRARDAVPGARPVRRRRRGHPAEQIEQFDRPAPPGVDARVVVYPGAPHSFFDRGQGRSPTPPRTPGAACSASLRTRPRATARRSRRARDTMRGIRRTVGSAARAAPHPDAVLGVPADRRGRARPPRRASSPRTSSPRRRRGPRAHARRARAARRARTARGVHVHRVPERPRRATSTRSSPGSSA